MNIENRESNYRTISEVVKNSYVIGKYQRGYRWDSINVKELLEDIYEDELVEYYDFKGEEFQSNCFVFNSLINKIKEKKGSEKYCLQPLVVRELNDKYNVIDGQQRLTTIYIILKALDDASSENNFPDTFSIEYESRANSGEFLTNIAVNTEPDSIDSEYMLQAFIFARDWFIRKNNDFLKASIDYSGDKDIICNEFCQLMRNTILNKTKFIWDEVEEGTVNFNKNEQKIFADRNTGRLELTDSELIKSLFMNPEYYGATDNGIKDRQILISEIWDIYENELHKQKFWRFVPIDNNYREKYEKSTRIDAIFYLLIVKNEIRIKESEENDLFKAIKSWIDKKVDESNENKTDIMVDCWREVCDIFDGINELYENSEIYNLLSLYEMIEDDSNRVYKTYLEVLCVNKSERKKILTQLTKSKLFGNGIEKSLKSLRYPNSNYIRNILVAYNIAITNSAIPINRFDFHFFDTIVGKWDVEHIYSTNEGYISSASIDEKLYLLDIFSHDSDNIYKKYIEYIYDIDIEKMESEISVNSPKEFINYCFDKSDKRYDMYFDIWRYAKLKEKALELLKKYDISKTLTNIIQSSNFDANAECFLQNPDYDDQEVFYLLRAEYLYWDDELKKQFSELLKNKSTNMKVIWHGEEVEVSADPDFWKKYDEEDTNYQNNFIRNYYRSFLNIIYDNTGIPAQNITFNNHGIKNKVIINDDNREHFKALFIGTIKRIQFSILDFFKKDESINPGDKEKGVQDNYRTWAAFVNDNSMGNMMLLPADINRAGRYRDANFSGKRKYVVELENIFLPIGTSNVLMGKFIDLESSTEQWLMRERMTYLKDMNKKLNAYFNMEENDEK